MSSKRYYRMNQDDTAGKDCYISKISVEHDNEITITSLSNCVHHKEKSSQDVGHRATSYDGKEKTESNQNEQHHAAMNTDEESNARNNQSDKNKKGVSSSEKGAGGKYCKYSRSIAFPMTIYDMVSETAIKNPEIIDWIADGEAFIIHNTGKELSAILKKYFHHGRYSSLQRQLNMYGWKKYVSGKYKGGFQHPHFHRDDSTEFKLSLIRRNGPSLQRSKKKDKQKELSNSGAAKSPKKRKTQNQNLSIKKVRELIPIQKKTTPTDPNISDHFLLCKEEMPSSHSSPRCVANGVHLQASDGFEFYNSTIQYSLNVSPLLCKEKLYRVEYPISKIKIGKDTGLPKRRRSNEEILSKPTGKELHIERKMESQKKCGSVSLKDLCQHTCSGVIPSTILTLPLPPQEEWSPFHNLEASHEDASVPKGQENFSNKVACIQTKCIDEEENEAAAAALVLSALCRSK